MSDFHVIKKICSCRSSIVLDTTKMFIIQRNSVYDKLKKKSTPYKLCANSHSEIFINTEKSKKEAICPIRLSNTHQ